MGCPLISHSQLVRANALDSQPRRHPSTHPPSKSKFLPRATRLRGAMARLTSVLAAPCNLFWPPFLVVQVPSQSRAQSPRVENSRSTSLFSSLTHRFPTSTSHLISAHHHQLLFNLSNTFDSQIPLDFDNYHEKPNTPSLYSTLVNLRL